MWRHQAICHHCRQKSAWQGDREKSVAEIRSHLGAAHQVADPGEPADFRVEQARQCDYCLAAYLDDCTKCRRDFCRLHAGDIDGLCGGCI
jgi:hypothetical protein